MSYLKEALQPPYLKDALPNQHTQLEDGPPFDARVGGFSGVAVGALADDDVGLFVFDLVEEVGQGFDWRGLMSAKGEWDSQRQRG